MKTYKAIFTITDHDEGFLQQGVAIEDKGEIWLVLSWLESIASKERIPEKLLCLSGLNHVTDK